MTVSEHLCVPGADRDLDWIKSALQNAIELEHATLPLYLAAMFSLEVQSYTTYNLIRSVAMEEMVHMAIACNVLAALGGSPAIKRLAPEYPAKGLPGGAEPDLQVVLARLSPWQVKNFMRLECPAFLLDDSFKKEQYPTISALYGAIRDAIRKNSAEVIASMKKGGKGNQIGDNIGFTTITYSPDRDAIAELDLAIAEIIEQGEGTPRRDLLAGSNFQYEESHYCKFAQISYGARYQIPKPRKELMRRTEPEFFKGPPIPWPSVLNTLAVPSDGYAALLKLDPNAAAVQKTLDNFDAKYTSIMADLDAMWNGPADKSWPTFGQAVGSMGDLRVLSCFYIMRQQVPPAALAQLEKLYPDEFAVLKCATDLSAPVFYGPRFRNQAAAPTAR